MAVTTLPADRLEDFLDVLCDAFRDYPVMRFVLGPRDRYDDDLRALIRLFVSGRVLRGEPVLGIHDRNGLLSGVATLSLPHEHPAPATFLALRERTWRDLGADARERYDAFADATQRLAVAEPNWHVHMLGVRLEARRGGFGRALLEAVHERSRSDPDSAGVSLTTEDASNVPWYERFGYRVVGHERLSDDLETWTLYRADGSESEP